MAKIAIISKKVDKKTTKVSWFVELDGKIYPAIYQGNKILPAQAKAIQEIRKPKKRVLPLAKDTEKINDI